MLAPVSLATDTARVMSHRIDRRVEASTRRILAVVTAALALATVVGVLILRAPSGPRGDLSGLGFASRVVDAQVVRSEDIPCEGQADPGVICRRVAFSLADPPARDQVVVQEFAGGATVPDLEPGDQVHMAYDANAPEGFRYRYLDRDRGSLLLWLGLLFVAAVVALGRIRGLAALAGLGVSLLVLIQFVLPAILGGRSPLAVAVVGSAAIAFLALYMAHGFTTMTTVALLGTLASLMLTAALASVFVELAELTGFASEEAVVVQIGAASLELRGIILGGVVIGALGALDDMTVTQASAVWELRAVDPRMSRSSLMRSGLRIGRDHVASTVNTLALAYAGASLPVLLLLVLSRQPVGTVLSGEVIATEVIRTLVGSIGLVAAVPLTTWLAAVAAPGEPAEAERRPAPR